MPVDTKSVTGRRQVRYATIDEILADAQRLAQTKVKTLGNWSFGQILKHISLVFEGGIDGIPSTVKWWMRWLLPLVKKQILHGKSPAGFHLSGAAEQQLTPPPVVSVKEGLSALQTAIERWKTESTRSRSPFLGELTREEWDLVQLRHAELHMSFVVLDDSVQTKEKAERP